MPFDGWQSLEKVFPHLAKSEQQWSTTGVDYYQGVASVVSTEEGGNMVEVHRIKEIQSSL